jgi:hypothetical protein
MSPSNVELLAQGFIGWGKDNPANMRDVLHPDCELVVPDSIPYGGTFRGAEAAIGCFTRELWQWFDEFTSVPRRLHRRRRPDRRPSPRPSTCQERQGDGRT